MLPLVTLADNIAIGTPVRLLDTPVMLLDLDCFERNAGRLLSVMRKNGVGWRPHSKAHKSPIIARMQIALGAHGVTCAKVSEAEVMVQGGVPSVLIANELAQPVKWRRVATLQSHAEVIVCVDSIEHLNMASDAGVALDVEIPLLVELNIGMDRCGISPGQPALDLACRIADAKGVRLAGVMGYEGHTLTLWPSSVKEAAIRESVGRLTETASLIHSFGLQVPIVSTGGSGSYLTSATVPGITELQAGGACFMDRFYAEQCHLSEHGFEFALTIMASVSGRPTPERAILDSGFKTMSEQPELKPIPLDLLDAEVLYLSAEHLNMHLGPNAPQLQIGDRVVFIPDYGDTTTFRHNEFIAHRNGTVELVIPLASRGRLT